MLLGHKTTQTQYIITFYLNRFTAVIYICFCSFEICTFKSALRVVVLVLTETIVHKFLFQVFYDKASVNALQSKDGQTIADLVALEVGQLGENMAVRRALYMQAEPGQHVGTYVHATGKASTGTFKKLGWFKIVVSSRLVD